MKEEKNQKDEPKIKKNPKGGWDILFSNGKLYEHVSTMTEAKKCLEEADKEEDKKEASSKMFS